MGFLKVWFALLILLGLLVMLRIILFIVSAFVGPSTFGPQLTEVIVVLAAIVFLPISIIIIAAKEM